LGTASLKGATRRPEARIVLDIRPQTDGDADAIDGRPQRHGVAVEARRLRLGAQLDARSDASAIPLDGGRDQNYRVGSAW
jgi:hypothetical protein